MEDVDKAPPVPDTLFDPHYLPLPVAKTADVKDPRAYGAHLFHRLRHGERFADSLDDQVSRLLFVGGGGFGKTQELHQIARRSSQSPLFQTLGGLQVRARWAEPGQEFVRCMANAMSAARHAVPKLTLPRLRDEAYVFLLDGLDEVSADRRELLIQLINEVATAYPQHRWVVASRHLPELDALVDFESWTPLTDRGWLQRYAESPSIQMADLETVTRRPLNNRRVAPKCGFELGESCHAGCGTC